MKSTIIFSFAMLALMSCNQSATTNTTSDSTSTAGSMSEEAVSYAYTVEHPDQWEWGSKKNTETALKALKGFETGDIAGTMDYWADSVRVQFDNYDQKLPKDSLLTMFTAQRAMMSQVSIKMEDFESVISKDKNWEWVTMWYKQITTDSKGVVDSVECVDDVQFKNGKIVLLDEKTRKLGPAK